MSSIPFDHYYRYDELTKTLHQLVDDHPDLVEVASYGKSYEGRDLWVVSVTNKATGSADEKPAASAST